MDSDRIDLIDTHCHLTFDPLWSDLDGVLSRAHQAGVGRIIVPAYDRKCWTRMPELSKKDGVFITYGLHPWVVDDRLDIADLRARLDGEGAVAIGEIGLDFKINDYDEALQMRCLRGQLDLAMAMSLPVLLHCRGAFEPLLHVLGDYPGLTGIIHAFSRGPQLVERFLDAGMHLAFGGGVTRAYAKRPRKGALATPDERLLLETDAPAIALENVAPEKVEPKHVRDIAQVIAQLRETTLTHIAQVSTENAERLFDLPA